MNITCMPAYASIPARKEAVSEALLLVQVRGIAKELGYFLLYVASKGLKFARRNTWVSF
jgi:hypothetical protein